MTRRRLAVLLLGLLTVAYGSVWGRVPDPSALWHIVHEQCEPHQRAANDPAPCVLVDLPSGTAVLKDLRGIAQFLLIPTARLAGIESPELLVPNGPNYFQKAWEARRFVEQRLRHPLPRDLVSLAINSGLGRSQDQLHIHVDCLRADIRDTLASMQKALGPGWSEVPEALLGHRYRALRIDGADLGEADPFHLLWAAVPHRDDEMGLHTLVLIGATFEDGRPGFLLLDDRVDLRAGDLASGEDLQDHTCSAVTAP